MNRWMRVVMLLCGALLAVPAAHAARQGNDTVMLERLAAKTKQEVRRLEHAEKKLAGADGALRPDGKNAMLRQRKSAQLPLTRFATKQEKGCVEGVKSAEQDIKLRRLLKQKKQLLRKTEMKLAGLNQSASSSKKEMLRQRVESSQMVAAAEGETGTISGTVTDAADSPVADVYVYVYTSDYTYAGYGYTDADGSYTVSGLASGSYKVQFDASDVVGSYISEWHSDKDSFWSADSVQVTAPDTVNVNAQLATGGSISGKVTNVNASPVADVYVLVYTNDYWSVGSAVTDTNGDYTVSGLPSGSYKLQFYASVGNYINEWHSDKSSFETADSVQVTAPNAVTGINAQLATGGSISGKVTNADATPVAGVDVYVYASSDDESAAGYASTEADGSYTVSGLRSGSYKVLFDTSWSAGSYLSEWHSDKGSFSAADLVQVTAPNAVTGINAELTVGGSISGKVTNANAVPVAGVDVYVYASSNAEWSVGSAVTDANGDYTVSGLRSDSYKVLFDTSWSAGSYLSEWHSDKASFSAATPVQVTAPNAVTGINAQLTVGGSISGKVTNASSSPVAGVNVTVFSSKEDNCGDYEEAGAAVTDANGNYTVSGLLSGSYKLQFYVVGDSYASEWHNDKNSFKTADLVQVIAPNAVTGINAQLTAGGSISGKVTNADASPVAGVSVYVYASDSDGSYAGYGYTGADGSYTVSGLLSGSYKVRFDASEASGGYLSEWHNDKGSLNAADVVQVTAPNAVTGINAQLAKGGSISGTVTNASSSPVADVSVYAYTSDGSYAGYGWTATDGSYTVSGLASGSYKVRFDASEASGGYLSEWHNDKGSLSAADVVQVTAPNAVTGINAQLAKGGSISGTVINADSNPVAYVDVYVYTSDGSYAGYGWTATDGSYTVSGLASGSYKVHFNVSYTEGDYASEWHSDKSSLSAADLVQVTAPNLVTGINAQLAKGGSISGRVTDESGMPIVSQSCWWYDDWSSPEVMVKNSSTGETIASGYVDSDGYYSIAGIPPGSYKVLFTAASLGYASQWYDGKDSFNSATIVDVQPSVTVENVNAALHQPSAAVNSIIKTLLLRRK